MDDRLQNEQEAQAEEQDRQREEDQFYRELEGEDLMRYEMERQKHG